MALGVLGAFSSSACSHYNTTLQFLNFLSVFFCGNIMNFGEMQLCELREECRKRGAKVDGRKKDLVER